MEQPSITAKDIEHFHKLFAEFRALTDKASNELNTAKLQQDRQINITRDGKPMSVKEKDLWDEVWHLGANSDAGKALSEKYPSVFQASKQANEKKLEMQKFARAQWDIDPLALSLSDIIRLIEGVVDYKLSKAA